MNDDRKWYVIVTKPKEERKVCTGLSKKKISYYCASAKTATNPSDKSKTSLFPNYIFVHVKNSELTLIDTLEGFAGYLYWHGIPAEISVEEISTLKFFLLNYTEVEIEKLKIPFKIQKDPDLANPAISIDGTSIIDIKTKIYLPSLGYALSGKVEKQNAATFNFSRSRRLSFYLSNKSFR